MSWRLLCVLLFVLAVSAPLRAQDDPTPFWISDVPKKKAPEKKAPEKKAPAKKKAPPPEDEEPAPRPKKYWVPSGVTTFQ